MDDAIAAAVRSVFDRLLTLAKEDRELRLRLRGVALEYLKATEEQPAVTAALPAPASEPEVAAAVVLHDAAVPPRPQPPLVESQAVPVAMPAEPAIGMSPRVVQERPGVGFVQVTDADLPLIESRCRLKVEGARWAATRRTRLQEGADFDIEIAPVDREIIEKAKQLPDCFLWMCHPTGPSPSDVSQWADVAGAFSAVASGIGLVRSLLDSNDDQSDRFEQSVFLLAEAQSALRVAIERVGGTADKDQSRVHHWLKATCSSRQLYIPRYMRMDDPADPAGWTELDERIGKLDAAVHQERQNARRQQSALNRIRYHLRVIDSHRNVDCSHDWQKVMETVEELIAGGMPPSNRDLRDLLLPAVDGMPDVGDSKPGFQSVLREIDRFLATRPSATSDAQVAAEPTLHVEELATLLVSQTVVLIGGERRPYAQKALEEAFGLKELRWISTSEHESIAPFEQHIAKSDVAVVMLAIRWSSHSYGGIKSFCDKYGKPLVRLPAGYSPNQVAAQVLEQCGDRLRQAGR